MCIHKIILYDRATHVGCFFLRFNQRSRIVISAVGILIKKMSQKRQKEDGKPQWSEGNTSDDKRQKKICSLRDAILKVMRLRRLQHSMELVLEPFIRSVVKEEVDLTFKKYLSSMKWNYGKETCPSESRRLQLQFSSTIALPVFTGTRIEGIEGEGHTFLKLSLVDAVTGEVVSCGPQSLAKVEIVALEGDFDGDDGNSWTHAEFENNIVRERDGKKPLLNGDAFLYLEEGVASVGEISFTDNSSWTRSRKFRLGARIVDNFDGVRVREAKTESFVVKDHRGELYKKHHPPSLLDEVWRLEKIGKGGAFHMRLTKEKVCTVKDFLTQFFLDPTRLRSILGTGMSSKMWEVTVEHAQTCVFDDQLYFYCPSGSQQKTGVVFNVVGQLKGLCSEGQYISVAKLSETEKVNAHELVVSAFRNWHIVVPFDNEVSLMMESSATGKLSTSENIDRCDYQQLNAPSPDVTPSICSMSDVDSMDLYGLHNIGSMDIKLDHPVDFSNCLANSLLCDTDITDQSFCGDEHLQFFDTDCSSLEPQADQQHMAVGGCLLAHSSILRVDKAQAQTRWTMLFSVFRWWFSIRRIMARKTRV